MNNKKKTAIFDLYNVGAKEIASSLCKRECELSNFNLCGWLNVFPLVVHSFHMKLSSTIQLEDLL